MARKRAILKHRRQRSILTDMLPFEVPPTFSNRGFYRFLLDYNVNIVDGQVQWEAKADSLDATMSLLFGLKPNTQISTTNCSAWGKVRSIRFFPLKKCRMDTIPFNFKISHNLEGRILSVIHPRNQIKMADFYAHHSSSIIHYTNLSEFSIRRPVSVSRYSYFNDKLHDQTVDRDWSGVEVDESEYEQLGSYFVYRKYRNIHQFFESYKYHRSEKKYGAMIQIDVSKCFDSIYTHSIAWAILGKPQTKFHLNESKETFAGCFDGLMQNLNHNETNGIVIGPEFSRIFAEIILQSVDRDLQDRLLKDAKLRHKVDYEIFRYVDDFFVFYNDASTQLKVIEILQDTLKAKKLSINSAKIKVYEQPIITEISVAKERVSSLLNEEINPRLEEITSDDEVYSVLKSYINSNRLIVRYKSVLKETKVSYSDILNYTLAILEKKQITLIQNYLKSDRCISDKKALSSSFIAITEFSFFIYSASPKVNHTVRLCRIVTTSVDFFLNSRFPHDLKHAYFKYVHDNIVQQLDKNSTVENREVESQHLLVVLSRIGREYWLPEGALLKYFSIEYNATSKEYSHTEFLNHFSITILLTYIKDKIRYNGLRSFLEQHIISKLEFKKAHCPNDAEALILCLDILVCPYLSAPTKASIAGIFGIDASSTISIQAANNYWFTAWGKEFDLGKELDAKRSREVY